MDHTYVLASYEMTQNLAYVAMTRHRENVHVFGSNLDFWRPEKLPEVLSKSGEKLSAADYLDANSLTKLMQEDDKLITKIFTRLSHELEAMGAVSKKAFWQVADHFLGVKRENEIRITSDFSEAIREEVRAETQLKTKDEPNLKELHEKSSQAIGMRFSNTSLAENKSLETTTKFIEPNFQTLMHQCEQRLHDLLGRENLPLAIDRKERIELQAERMAGYIMHSHGLNGGMPRESGMVQLSRRAEYELSRVPEIQRDLMDEREENPFRAYKIAERLASIEGRLTYETVQKGTEPPLYLSYVAKKEFNQHREQLPDLAQELMKWYDLSDTAAQHCAQNMLRYKEMQGAPPSADQTAKMAQISRQLEHKEYTHLSHDREAETSGFLRGREADLLFRNGLVYDASRELDHAQLQVKKSLEAMQRQLEKERELATQREFFL